MKLLQNLIRSENTISGYFERWAPETDFNALEIIMKSGDKKMLREFLTTTRPNRKQRMASQPHCTLKEVDTG